MDTESEFSAPRFASHWPPCRYCGSYRTNPANSHSCEDKFFCPDCKSKFKAVRTVQRNGSWAYTKRGKYGNVYEIHKNVSHKFRFRNGYWLWVNLFGTEFWTTFGGMQSTVRKAEKLSDHFDLYCTQIALDQNICAKSELL